jgi:predicted DsbA family dithiol-disulfide isomerase
MTCATAANTRDCHRLLLLASEYEQTWPLATALYNAYFRDGVDLNDHTPLPALPSEPAYPLTA